jgi:hypothetical protein
MPWDHFNIFTNRIAQFHCTMVLGQWFKVAMIQFVLMNTYHHLFGSLIGLIVSSFFRQGHHNFLFSKLFLLLFQSYFLPHIWDCGLSLGLSKDKLNKGVFLYYYFCLIEAIQQHIHSTFQEICPHLN